MIWRRWLVKIPLGLLSLCIVGNVANANLRQSCSRILCALTSDGEMVARIAKYAGTNRTLLQDNQFGAVWLDYLDRYVADSKYSRQYELANSGLVLETITWMRSHLNALKDMQPKVRAIDRSATHAALLSYLDHQLNRMVLQNAVARSDLFNAGILFSKIAGYLNGNRNPDPYPDGSPEQFILQISYTEADISQKFGLTAVPLPISRSLSFADFLAIEGTGVIPFGLAVDNQFVDGTELDARRFFEHDTQHFETRFAIGNDRVPLTVLLLDKRGPVDLALFADQGKALEFWWKLQPKLQELPTPRMRVLTEAVLFAFIHERTDYYGINDFNPTRLRKIARDVLKSEASGSRDAHSFDAVYDRFQDRRNFGQAFKVPPSKDEVRAVCKWISELENASFARQ